MSGHRFHVPLLVVLVAAAWTSAAAAQQPPTLERARALYDSGRLGEARAMLEDLARAQPRDAGVHLLLGVVERTTGHLGEAIASLERAHALEPESSQAAVELATTLAWAWRSATPPSNSTGRCWPGIRRTSAHSSALGSRSRGRVVSTRPASIFGDLSGANPRSVDAWIGLGFVERAALQRTDAEAAYRQALALDPANKDALAALNELHWDRRTTFRVLGGWRGRPPDRRDRPKPVSTSHTPSGLDSRSPAATSGTPTGPPCR